MKKRLEELIEKLGPADEIRPKIFATGNQTKVVLAPTPPISHPLREKALLFKGALVNVLRIEEIKFSFEDMRTILIDSNSVNQP